MITQYSIALGKDEEKIAQLLTRDAWGYFSALISQREAFHVKEIPMMPRGGLLEIANDAELIQYYIDNADTYREELAMYQWDEARYEAAAASFVDKVEQATGLRRGMGTASVGMAG
jgi:hypothetical protein